MSEGKKDECYFHRDNDACGILMDTYCGGVNPSCTFMKTKEQYVEEKDAAIKLCRSRGMCGNCKYAQNGVICKLSTE